MNALGDRPAAAVTTREIDALLASVARTGVTPRTVNKARAIISAIFNYGMRPSTFELAENPAKHADRRDFGAVRADRNTATGAAQAGYRLPAAFTT